MVGKPTKLSIDTTTIEFTVAEPLWSTLYEKRCELEVYRRWHEFLVPKACSVKNNQMQRRVDHFHAIQKARKHLKEKVQEQAIKSINEVNALDDERDISDFSNSSNDDFQKFLHTNIRHCC